LPPLQSQSCPPSFKLYSTKH